MNSDTSQRLRAFVCLAGGILGSLLVLWILSSIFRAGDPNLALARTAERAAGATERAARTTEKAVEMAAQSRRDAEMARRASSAFRVTALAAGVCVPLVVAYLIYRVSERAEARPQELSDALERARVIEPAQPTRRFPRPARLLPREDGRDRKAG